MIAFEDAMRLRALDLAKEIAFAEKAINVVPEIQETD